MNIKKILQLANHLGRLRNEKHYDQKVFAKKISCGTAACIAGHTVMIFNRKLFQQAIEIPTAPRVYHPWVDIGEIATKELELREYERRILFTVSPDQLWPKPWCSRWAGRYLGQMGKDPKRRPSRIAAAFLRALAKGEARLVRPVKEKDFERYRQEST